MTAAVYRNTPAFSPPQTQNTALVLEFNCLYTHDIRRKQKRWQDGFLRYHTFNKRVMLYDVPRNFIGDTHWKADEALQEGDEFTLEKHGVMVEVADAAGSTETDLTELRKSTHKPSSDRGSSPPVRGPHTPAPRVVNNTSTRAPTQLKHRSLNALLGTPHGQIGKATLPAKSPYELRHNDVENHDWEQGRQPKRQRMDSPAAWNVTRTTIPAPHANARAETPLWARTADAAKQKQKKKASLPAGQQNPKAREVVDLRDDEPEPERFLPGFSSDALVPLSSPSRDHTPLAKQKAPVRSSSPAFQTQKAPIKLAKNATFDATDRETTLPPGAESDRREAPAQRPQEDTKSTGEREQTHEHGDREAPSVRRTDTIGTSQRQFKLTAHTSTSASKGSTLRVSADVPRKKKLLCQDQLTSKPKRISSTNTDDAADRLLGAASDGEDGQATKTQRQLLDERLARIRKKEAIAKAKAVAQHGEKTMTGSHTDPRPESGDAMIAAEARAHNAQQLSELDRMIVTEDDGILDTSKEASKDALGGEALEQQSVDAPSNADEQSHTTRARTPTHAAAHARKQVGVGRGEIEASRDASDDQASEQQSVDAPSNTDEALRPTRTRITADAAAPARKVVGVGRRDTEASRVAPGGQASERHAPSNTDEASHTMRARTTTHATAPAPARKKVGVGRREIRATAQSCFQKGAENGPEPERVPVPVPADPELSPSPQKEDRQFRRVVSDTHATTAAAPKRIPGAPMRFTPSPTKHQAAGHPPGVNTANADSTHRTAQPQKPLAAPKKPLQRAASLNTTATGTTAVLLGRPFKPPKSPAEAEVDVAPPADAWSREAFDLFEWRPPGWCEERWCFKALEEAVDEARKFGAARGRAAHVATASSSQKKRRLAPFDADTDSLTPEAQFDQAALETHAKSSPSSSPQPPSFETSDSPSPASSHTTHTTTPPRTLPAHIHEEVLQSRELASGAAQSEGGASPSGLFAGIHIDSGSSMSGSEHGGNSNNSDQRALSSPNRGLGGRSSSPAKRSAEDMEGAGSAGNHATQQTQQTVPVTVTQAQENGRTDFDEAMDGMTNASNSMDTQDTVADSAAATSAEGTMTGNTSATSLESDELPPYPEEDAGKWKKGSSKSSSTTLPSIDEQVQEVYQIVNSAPLDEGTKGYIVSSKWLARVMSRSTDGLEKTEFAKESREGPIGMVDNSDLVPPGAFASELPDLANHKFVPLKPGLLFGEDFQVLPEKAWGLVVGWYGRPQGQDHTIVRYAHNTADPSAQNIQYELYPPVVTIRKVPQPSQQTQRPPTPPGGTVEALRRGKEMRARGQSSPDDAIRLVSSQSERFQMFLRRAKEAAGIPAPTKVKLWRELVPENVAVDSVDNMEATVRSPPESRSASPAKAARTTAMKLVVSLEDFKAMEVGSAIEHMDARDETNNDKYNGASTVATHGIFADQTILLEEQIGGPGGGEFQSDGKKGPKLALSKKNGSKSSSAPASGRTSPTPGGMLTRGRARRDGRTRGTVGLTNLGNTCYMNSALQCIRSVKELALYFLSGSYKAEINTSNPLGHKGVMAKQYAVLLEGIYTDTASGAFSPNAFKRTLGNIQPLFSGYQQQDSQEFLSFLVDALHEDLNRIIKKPYNENPDSDDKTVHDPQAIIELGETYRRNHKARNDSVAMDLFSGFYKNTMECPVCDKISITFDPFSSLTVQLPIESTFQHTITFVPLNGAPINHAVDIDKNASIKTLKDNIASKHPGVTGDRLWMVEVYNHKIYKVFENQLSIAEANLQANDYIFVYELPGVPTNVPEPSQKKSYSSYSFNSSNDREALDMDSSKADSFAVPVFSRQKNRFGNGWEIIMHPLYIMVTREQAQDYDIILKKVLIAVSRMTSRAILTEFDTDKPSSGETSAADAPTNGEAEKEESAGEEAARLSDRSVPSEDGYVDVSIDKPAPPNAEHETKDADAGADQKAHPIPARFMDPQYFINPALRNQLFALNFSKSADGAHCTGMSSISEREVRNMFDRVKKPVRRASVQSSTSDNSSTSTGSGQADAESDESDADDDEEKPDITLGMGEEDTLHLQTPTSAEPTTDDELPENPLLAQKSNGRRRANGKPNKFGKNKTGKKGNVTYSKKEARKARRGQQQRPGSSGSLRSTQSQRSLGGKTLPQDDNPYYIKLGEGIVLDWYPEALDSIFGGDPKVEDEMRGTWLSSADGKGLDFLPDPILDAKKEKRAARKKNGITLEDCFVETGKREILSEDNAWYCGRCKEMRQAAKTLEIWTIPDILIVHLKRFGGNRSFRDKIDVFVDYPVEGLDMTEKVGYKEDGKEYLYDLFAVDNHYGGLGGGHYTALTKNFYDEQWYDYNDSSCSKASEAKVHSPAAYLLFYRRRSATPLGPPALQNIVNAMDNPAQSESAGEDADDPASGEGRLGDPISSLRGSPSASLEAGAGTNGSLPSLANGGLTGAGNSLTTKGTMMTGPNDSENGLLGTINGKRIIGPERPPHLQYGAQGSASWSFDGLAQQPTGADERDTDALLEDLDGGDADSNVAEADHDSAIGDDNDYQHDIQYDNEPADEEYDMRNSSRYGGVNTEFRDTDMSNYEDDHALYSGAHAQRSGIGALHLEDTAMMGADDDSPPAQEIQLDDIEEVTGEPHEMGN